MSATPIEASYLIRETSDNPTSTKKALGVKSQFPMKCNARAVVFQAAKIAPMQRIDVSPLEMFTAGCSGISDNVDSAVFTGAKEALAAARGARR